MEEILNVALTIIKVISYLIASIGTILLIIGSTRGTLKVLWKLGRSLYKRKIGLFGGSEADSLENLLVNSQFIKRKNIERLGRTDCSKTDEFSMVLLYYPEFQECLQEILSRKKNSASMIVYAPVGPDSISDSDMQMICKQQNTTVVNMRGRLLNDILISMITTKHA